MTEREKAVEALTEKGNDWGFTPEGANDLLDFLTTIGWSPSPVPTQLAAPGVDREAWDAAVDRILAQTWLGDELTPRAVADALLASNLLRPVPSVEEIAEFLADRIDDPEWSRRVIARDLIALLRGEKR